MLTSTAVRRTLVAFGLSIAGFAQTTAMATPMTLPSAASADGHPAQVSIPDTLRIALTSKVNGHAYAIDIALPQVPPPPAGYPVIYVLDGDRYFASFVEATRANGNAPQAIVVGIGYPHTSEWIRKEVSQVDPRFKSEPPDFGDAEPHARAYDLTLPNSDPTEYCMFSPAQAIVSGGVDDLLKTIELEIKPRLHQLLDVDQSNQAVFGHSFGGLAVLEALFTEPTAFRTFIAASPSIWWADRAVLEKEKTFDAKVASGQAAPRVLITIGGDEETSPKLPPALSSKQAELDATFRAQRAIGNACDLATRLKSLRGAGGYEVADCAAFPHQGHGVAVWPAIGRAVAFAFPH